MTGRGLLASATLGLILAACGQPPASAPPPRPVKSMVVGSVAAEASFELPGEVRARVESPLAFRVSGRVTRRHVDAGAQVRTGQVLAELDPADLHLAASAAGADVLAARSQFNLAEADLARYRDLRAQNFISQAELERHENTYRAARSRLDAARAQAGIAGNQSDYARLRAPHDGVITAVSVEPGQVVNAGQAVMQFAEPTEKEIAVSVAENQLGLLRAADRLQVRLWVAPDQVYAAKLRELNPAADPVTRTYAARVSVPDAGADMRLGMTASVRVELRPQAHLIRLPLAALVRPADAARIPDDDPSGAAVWLVDGAGKVSRTSVRLAGFSGNEVLIAAGLAEGQRVVTAGAARLREGQTVRLLPEDETAQGNPAQGGGSAHEEALSGTPATRTAAP